MEERNYKLKTKVIFIVDVVLLAMLLITCILMNIMDVIEGGRIAKFLAIAGISLFFIFVIFNFIVFSPNFYIMFKLSHKVKRYIEQEKYNEGILYLETILIFWGFRWLNLSLL